MTLRCRALQAVEALKRLETMLVGNLKENPPPASSEPAFFPYFLKVVLVPVAIAVSAQFVDRNGVWLFALLCRRSRVALVKMPVQSAGLIRTQFLVKGFSDATANDCST